MKVYPGIVLASEAIAKGGLIRAGYLHTALATQLERVAFLALVYPNMPSDQLATLGERMTEAFRRGQIAQEYLYSIGYARNIPKGVRQ